MFVLGTLTTLTWTSSLCDALTTGQSEMRFRTRGDLDYGEPGDDSANRLRFQCLAQAFGMLALAGQFCHAFGIGTSLTAVFLSLGRDTATGRTCAFRCCSHKNSLVPNVLLRRNFVR
jgi:hypothetical protein